MSSFRYMRAAWGASLRSALEYRVSFLLQAGLMLLNNLLWLSFWAVLFARFRTVRGWTLRDVTLLYAVTATGFGLAATLLGGTLELSSTIVSGGLDTWLLRGRSVLLQAATSRMRFSGFGDVATGAILVAASGEATAARFAAWVAMSCVAALVLAAFWVACHALAFWLGRVEALAMFGSNALITFAVYPPALFQGPAGVLLYTVIPAALVSWLPVQLLRSWSWTTAGELALGVTGVLVATGLFWRAGLARYESGNLTQAVGD